MVWTIGDAWRYAGRLRVERPSGTRLWYNMGHGKQTDERIMAVSDDIGTRGEALFYVLMTQFCGRQRPFFRPHFLGSKFTALDYLVELVDAGPITPYCFVQVKTTIRGYTRGSQATRRLKVQVSKDDMQRLVSFPAPTYVIGIDERDEIGYIVSANAGSPERFASLPAVFPLTCETLAMLWDEVRIFWSQRDMTLTGSVFAVDGKEKR